MRILITGACGYLGGRLAEALPYDLVLGARAFPAWYRARFAHADLRMLDVLSSEQLAQAVAGVDAVVQLASLDENEAGRDPDLALRVSAEGTRRLLAACRDAKVRRVVYLSTFHVYGPDAPTSIDESVAVRPAHPYAISRLAGEGYCYHNNRLSTATQAVVLRMSNGYGAPLHAATDRWSLAHNDFCRQAFDTRRIVLKTSGVQHRDMVGMTDVAHAIDLVLRAERLEHDLMHVGGDHSLSMFDLAETVRKVAERVLRQTVTVERPAAGSESVEPVRFSIARMRALGYAPSNHLLAETERMLELLAAGAQAV